MHRISRPFLVLLAAASLAAAAAVPLAAAADTRSTDRGTLNWGANILPTTWDPVTSSAGNDAVALNLVYAALTKLDAKGTAVPGLASSWQFRDKGRTVRFVLRPGLKFSDGTPVDAEAYPQNILRGQKPTSLIAPQLASIVSAKVISPTTIDFHLKSLDYGLPLRLAGKTGMIVSPKAFYSNAGGLATQPVGAGPFRLTNLVPGSTATLERNPDYWDAANIKLKGVTIQQITNPQTLLAAVQSGQVDVALIPGAVANAAKNAGLFVKVVPSLSVASIEVNAAMAPFDDHRVVQAINYALDRKALQQTYNAGIGGVSVEPFPAGYVGWSPQVASLWKYDPAKAKAILAQIGHPVSFKITYFPVPPFDAVAQQIQGQLSAVGITTTLESIPLSQATTRVYVNHDVAFNPNAIVGRESPLQMLNIQYAADGLLNPCRCASKELSAALAATATFPLDSEQYKAALRKSTELAVKESANMFLFTLPRIYAFNARKVHNWPSYLIVPRLEGVTVD